MTDLRTTLLSALFRSLAAIFIFRALINFSMAVLSLQSYRQGENKFIIFINMVRHIDNCNKQLFVNWFDVAASSLRIAHVIICSFMTVFKKWVNVSCWFAYYTFSSSFQTRQWEREHNSQLHKQICCMVLILVWSEFGGIFGNGYTRGKGPVSALLYIVQNKAQASHFNQQSINTVCWELQNLLQNETHLYSSSTVL